MFGKRILISKKVNRLLAFHLFYHIQTRALYQMKALDYETWLRYIHRRMTSQGMISETKTLIDVEAMRDWRDLYSLNVSAALACEIHRGKERVDGIQQPQYAALANY